MAGIVFGVVVLFGRVAAFTNGAAIPAPLGVALLILGAPVTSPRCGRTGGAVLVRSAGVVGFGFVFVPAAMPGP